MKIFRHFLGLLATVATCSALATPLLSEGFNNVGTLGAGGWAMTNNSSPPGSTGWFQGTSAFSAAAGPADSYIAANFENAAFGGAISNWLITPELALANGETLNFSWRVAGDGFLDTIMVYMSTNGASTDVGSSVSSTGDFTLLTSVSASDDLGWSAQSLTVAGLGGPGSGRFAFRYVVGDTATAGNFIGLDSISVDAAVPEPASLTLAALALGVLGLARRRARDTSSSRRLNMLKDFLKRSTGRFLVLAGLSVSAIAAHGAGQAPAQNGLMTFPNAKVVNQPPAPGLAQPSTPTTGMTAFKDPVTGALTGPTAEQAAALEAAGKSTAPALSRRTLSSSQATTIYPAQGGVGMVLDDAQTTYIVARKDADGKLVEECLPDQSAAVKALQPARNPSNKSALKGELK